MAGTDDGTDGARFCVGVQWHPEVGADPSLFEAFVAAAAPRASDRGSEHGLDPRSGD